MKFGEVSKHWFLFGVAFVIFIAKLYPAIGEKNGILRPDVTVKYGAVSFIFLTSGLSLRAEDLTAALLKFRLHAFVQGFTFIVIPLIVMALNWMLSEIGAKPQLLKGLATVSAMPPPVSSAVILTKAVGGNEAAAIFNSAFGSILGIFITPVILLHLLGETSSVPIASTIRQLSLTVVFPVVIGQLVRGLYKDTVIKFRSSMGVTAQLMLLLIIFTTFCDMFISEAVSVNLIDIILVVNIVVLLQVFLLWITFVVCSHPRSGFTPWDTVSAMFAATHKSLTLGMPMLKIIFEGYSQLSQLAVPLLVYHPTQILLGGFLVPFLRSWLQSIEDTSQNEEEDKDVDSAILSVVSDKVERKSWSRWYMDTIQKKS